MKKFKKTYLMMLLLAAAALVSGCKKEPEPDPNGTPNGGDDIEQTTPNPAQDTPLWENVFPEFKSIYQLSPNSDGSFYGLAGGEDTDYLLKLDRNGYVQQRVELGFRSRRCILKTGENIMIVGNSGYSTSPYEMYDRGFVAIYDQNLQQTAITYLSEPQYRIELNTVIQDIEHPSLFYAGGMAIDGNYVQYPYVCALELSNGLLNRLDCKVLTEYEKQRIVGMVEKIYSGQKDLILETIYYTMLDYPYDYTSCAVHIIKPDIFEEHTGWGSETWEVALTGPHSNSYTGNNSIDSDENNIYFFGDCDDDKDNVMASGGLWNSGFVAAVNWHTGQMVWTRLVPLTNHDDRFYDGMLSDGYLYACGMHGGMHYTNTHNYFANGLVAKLSLSGELVTTMTFGDPKRSSYLCHLVKDLNGNMVCAGETGENLGEGKLKYSGWFFKMEMSGNSHKASLNTNIQSEINESLNLYQKHHRDDIH